MSATSPESFFNIFLYHNMMHDAIDGGLVYEAIEIKKDIKFPSGRELRKGTKFDAVWFIFRTNEFNFINWRLDGPNMRLDGPNMCIPNGNTSITLTQAELAPFLKW